MTQTITDTVRMAERERWGFASGAVMALGASLSFAAARAGILGGLGTVDMIFARFLVAAAIMLPLLVRFGIFELAGIGLRRGLILTLLGGVPFALLQTGGYGEMPGPFQIAGLVLVTAGLLTTVGVFCRISAARNG